MNVPRSYIGLISRYKTYSEKIQDYFYHLPSLVEISYDPAIAYMFSQVEIAHRLTLYAGLLRRYRLDSGKTRQHVNDMHLTREYFEELFEKIFGKGKIDKGASRELQEAQKIRNKIMHGQNYTYTEKEARKTICHILEYAKKFNNNVKTVDGFEPFGSLRGVVRGGRHDEETTYLIIRGLGFDKENK